jgi:chromosome segregation ATPase
VIQLFGGNQIIGKNQFIFSDRNEEPLKVFYRAIARHLGTAIADELIADILEAKKVSETKFSMTTEQRLDRIEGNISSLTEAQRRTQAQLDQLVEMQIQTQGKLNQMSNRVDEFVFQAQRLFSQVGGKLDNVEGQAERLEAIVSRLDRNYEEQQSQLREFRVTTNAALERIDRVLDFLVRQQGGET